VLFDVQGCCVLSFLECNFLETIAIIFAIGLGGFMVLVILMLGLRKFQSNIPVAGNCSAAISAACHPPEDDKEAAQKRVMWGETILNTAQIGEAEVNDSLSHPHCTFTSQHVVQPSPTKTYA
jgi:hypothetical protein